MDVFFNTLWSKHTPKLGIAHTLEAGVISFHFIEFTVEALVNIEYSIIRIRIYRISYQGIAKWFKDAIDSQNLGLNSEKETWS